MGMISVINLYNRIWRRKAHDTDDCIEKGSRTDVALGLIGNGERLLDVGCGNGCWGYGLWYREVYGVDVSEIAVEIAGKKYRKVVCADIDTDMLPFPDGWFDAVVCLDVIEHVFDPEKLVGEMRRVLKVGGVLVLATPNIRYWKHLWSLVVKGRFPRTSGDREGWDGGHLHYFTFGDIERLLDGFEIVERRGVFGRDWLKELRSPGIVVKAINHNGVL